MSNELEGYALEVMRVWWPEDPLSEMTTVDNPLLFIKKPAEWRAIHVPFALKYVAWCDVKVLGQENPVSRLIILKGQDGEYLPGAREWLYQDGLAA